MYVYRKRGCHDCLRLGLCDNPKAHRDSDYICKFWEFRYD